MVDIDRPWEVFRDQQEVYRADGGTRVVPVWFIEAVGGGSAPIAEVRTKALADRIVRDHNRALEGG